MAESVAATLEASPRAQRRPLDELSVAGKIVQPCSCPQHHAHVLSVWFPISRQSQRTARCQCRHQQLDQVWLDEAAFVMAFLWPGVRKEDMHLCQRARRYLLAQHFDC